MKRAIVICMTTAAGYVLAGVYGDVPDAKHAWAVHDRNRPNPVKISAEPGLAPSDATVLFDGTEESFRKNWKHSKSNRKADWNVVGDSLIFDIKKDKVTFDGDSSLVGNIPNHISKKIVAHDAWTLTLEQSGVHYVYYRRNK